MSDDLQRGMALGISIAIRLDDWSTTWVREIIQFHIDMDIIRAADDYDRELLLDVAKKIGIAIKEPRKLNQPKL